MVALRGQEQRGSGPAEASLLHLPPLGQRSRECREGWQVYGKAPGDLRTAPQLSSGLSREGVG